MLLTVDVLGLKVDVLVVDPIKIDVLELVQLGGPGKKYRKNSFILWFKFKCFV
jgi:hypothetical protein